jgi:hypothetical protein
MFPFKTKNYASDYSGEHQQIIKQEIVNMGKEIHNQNSEWVIKNYSKKTAGVKNFKKKSRNNSVFDRQLSIGHCRQLFIMRNNNKSLPELFAELEK